MEPTNVNIKNSFFKTTTGIVIITVVALAAGFFGGQQYEIYKVKTAFNQAFSQRANNNQTVPAASSPQTMQNTPASNNAAANQPNYIDKKIGDEISLETIKLKILGAKEQPNISSSYGSSVTAAVGAKFVVVSMELTNLTSDNLTLPSNPFPLFDNKGRQFSEYNDTIGHIDNYLDMAQLAPSIAKQGVYVYEVPNDSAGLYLATASASTGTAYKIDLGQ